MSVIKPRRLKGRRLVCTAAAPHIPHFSSRTLDRHFPRLFGLLTIKIATGRLSTWTACYRLDRVRLSPFRSSKVLINVIYVPFELYNVHKRETCRLEARHSCLGNLGLLARERAIDLTNFCFGESRLSRLIYSLNSVLLFFTE